jgi:hypothetical protein
VSAVAISALLLLTIGTGAAAPSTGPVVATLSVLTSKIGTLPPGFWGADVRPNYAMNSSTLLAYNATPLTTLRWPGGGDGDEYNYTANRLYNDNGTSFSPPTNESEFIQFCRDVHCQAILELPGEIDDPSTAAYYVEYTLRTFHFTPAYWEIGNEPAQWTHEGIPWASWNTSQARNATPGTYAQLAHAYIAAIRTVAPTASFIGLPGVGTGGYDEAVWIRATVALNGPNLSAVSIHVYPAGGSVTGGLPTEASFLADLGGHGALPYRIPIDRAAIRNGCPSCKQIRLLVTELGSGTQGGSYARYMAGFADTLFLAAEGVQGVTLSMPVLAVYAWQSTYNGSLLTPTGAVTNSYALYTTFFEHLDPAVLNTSLTHTPGNVFAVATRNVTGTGYALLVVNANLTAAVQFGLVGSGFPVLGAGSEYTWTALHKGPNSSSWALVPPLTWTLPPSSILLLSIA